MMPARPESPHGTPPAVLAVGAWLKNAACLVTGDRVQWSPVHGDLSDPAACHALAQSVQALCEQADALGTPVQAIAHDLHPDFYSTQLAVSLANARGIPCIGVQHHHAHMAVVMAEHRLNGPVVGLALDGVGLGTDGTAWGGELLWLDGSQWTRLGHLQPLALPGGDRAAREPWRMAASALHALGRADEIQTRFGLAVGEATAGGVQQMLQRNVQCPTTSSAGRWFDAAAGALGVCLRQQDEAQAAIALEQLAAQALHRQPDVAPLAGARHHGDGRIDLLPVLAQLFSAHDTGAAAAGFHLALADALAHAATTAARAHRASTVLLGGGCFFNQILRERVTTQLQQACLRVCAPCTVNPGDAGLALGQAWVAIQQLTQAHRIAPTMKDPLPCA